MRRSGLLCRSVLRSGATLCKELFKLLFSAAVYLGVIAMMILLLGLLDVG